MIAGTAVQGLYPVAPNGVRRGHFDQGRLVERFRARQDPSPAAEDWTTADLRPRGSDPSSPRGLGRIEVGDEWPTIAELVAADPEEFLGDHHLRRWGSQLGYLVKIFDPDRRIPVHAHPTDAFAAEHLDRPVGKTEAWIVLATEGAGPNVWLGFREPLTVDELAARIVQQHNMVDLLVPIRLEAGDTVVVPAGMPHAMGPGMLVIEPQQASDWSILAEYDSYGLSSTTGLLGMTPELAAAAFDRRGWRTEQIEHRFVVRGGARLPAGETRLLPSASDFFRASGINARSPITVDLSAPATLIVTDGGGELARGGSEMTVGAGEVLFAPHVGGELRVDPAPGGLHVLIVSAAGDDR